MDKSLKEVKHFYINQTDRYFKLLSKIEKDLPKNIHKGNLHQIRLTIKKMKAVHQFFKIMELQIEPVAKLHKQINQINQPLGIIRECQINRELAKVNLLNYQTQKKYLAYLDEQKVNDYSQLKKKLRNATFHYNNAKLNQINKELSQLEEYRVLPKLNTFFLAKVDSIHQLLYNLTDEKQIHQIRKNLKHIKSVMTSVNVKELPEIKKFQKKLNTAEQQIGTWHDTIVFRDSLLEFCFRYPENENAVTINLEFIEAENLMFQNRLPEVIDPLIIELRSLLEIK